MASKRGKLTVIAIAVAVVSLIVLAFGAGGVRAAVPGTIAQITSPAANANVSGTIQVQGTATSPDFQFYKVELGAGTSPTTFSLIGSIQKTQVTNGTLVSFDTTTVPDGTYTLRLTTVDNTGNYVEASVVINVANAAAEQAAETPRRGCLACHVKIAPDGRYTLGFEAANAVGPGQTHPTVSPSGVSIKPTDQTGPEPCLECHKPNPNAPERGVAAPINLRNIVHPAHMFSETFLQEFTGNCFSCHNVSGTGVFDILGQKVSVNAEGVPNTVPIPGAIPPP